VEVRLPAAQPLTMVDRLRRLPEVATVEAWGLAPAAFARAGQIDVLRTYPDRGHGSLLVMAPPATTRLVHLPLNSSRWLLPGDREAVALNHAARKARRRTKPNGPKREVAGDDTRTSRVLPTVGGRHPDAALNQGSDAHPSTSKRPAPLPARGAPWIRLRERTALARRHICCGAVGFSDAECLIRLAEGGSYAPVILGARCWPTGQTMATKAYQRQRIG
jgi:hypothetical protein